MAFLKFAEDVLSKNPLIIVGSGTSCGAGISGMGALGEFLVKNISTEEFDIDDIEKWDLFREKISQSMGLEEVLQSLGNVSDRFTNSIVHNTWNCILSDETNPLLRISNGEDVVGFVRLFKRFKDTNIDCINVITTNYDHLIEISAAIEDWEIWDGFGSGMLSRPMNSTLLRSKMKRYIRRSRTPIFENIKHVKIFKPHGSLSWFRLANDSFVKIPYITSNHLSNLKQLGINPVIVTPGIGKYLETHYEPYNNVMAEMQNSIQFANAMIFLGFGFNDIHIQASFQSVLRDIKIPKLIVTRNLTPSFFTLVEEKGIKNYYAIEKFDDGCRLFSDFLTEEVYLGNSDGWSLKGLLNMVWGEEQ